MKAKKPQKPAKKAAKKVTKQTEKQDAKQGELSDQELDKVAGGIQSESQKPGVEGWIEL